MATMAVTLNEPNPVSSSVAWRAVEGRDASYDGRFVYAVRSTGVFCKPSCPSRRALRSNVAFFPTTAAAERAGFRACRRCRPTDQSGTHPAIEKARAYLDAHVDRLVSLDELATVVGLSASHLQRSFKRALGVSPKEYQSEHRMRRFKSRCWVIDHLASHRCVEIDQAADHAGRGVHLPAYGDFERVIMAVPVRVITFAIDRAIVFRRQLVAVQAMRR